jgi:hypothetical protein
MAGSLPPHPESLEAEAARRVAMKAPTGGEVSDEVRRAMLEGLSDRPLPLLEQSRRGAAIYAWFAAALVLAGMLAAQILSSNGGWLARTLGVGGSPLPSLAAYQQQVWGVTGEPGANGMLRVRASILNGSAQLQPYPLLRITLTDRFGNRIGTRDFEPAEYLGRPTVKMLAPGERVDATLDIQDPGRDAEGYELDVCLRASQPTRVVCAADNAPAGSR